MNFIISLTRILLVLWEIISFMKTKIEETTGVLRVFLPEYPKTEDFYNLSAGNNLIENELVRECKKEYKQAKEGLASIGLKEMSDGSFIENGKEKTPFIENLLNNDTLPSGKRLFAVTNKLIEHRVHKSIGEQIREARVNMMYSKIDMAKKIGVPTKKYSLIEGGEYTPKVEVLISIAKLLKTKIVIE